MQLLCTEKNLQPQTNDEWCRVCGALVRFRIFRMNECKHPNLFSNECRNPIIGCIKYKINSLRLRTEVFFPCTVKIKKMIFHKTEKYENHQRNLS